MLPPGGERHEVNHIVYVLRFNQQAGFYSLHNLTK